MTANKIEHKVAIDFPLCLLVGWWGGTWKTISNKHLGYMGLHGHGYMIHDVPGQ